MDPNWFYSSLAQSAAAIVGIISALLFSKLQDIRKDGFQSRFELNREIEKWDKIKKEIITTVSEYGPYTVERPQVPWDNIPKFNLDYNFEDLLHDIDTFDELESIMREFMNAESKLYYNEKDITGEYAPHYNYYFKDDEEICKKITNWWIHTKYLINRIKIYNDQLMPNNYKVIVMSLGFIFITCVIWPLSYLDSYSDYFYNIVTYKSIFLVFFIFGFIVLLSVILKQIQEIQTVLKI